MLQAMKQMLNRDTDHRKEEFRTLTEELDSIRLALRQAEGRFNTASDPQLVEATVFEIKALQARHAYLLGRIKGLAQPGKSAFSPREEPIKPAGGV